MQCPICLMTHKHELINLLATSVRNKIINEIKEAKYYGILFDSTPDASHTEQMSEVIRYVRLDYQRCEIDVCEAFIGFVE